MARKNIFTKTQRRLYRKKEFRNPYFQKVRKIPWKGIVVAAAMFVVFVLFIRLLYSSPRLAIQRVNIDGLEYIDREQIEQVILENLRGRALFVFRASNQFLFSSQILNDELEEAFALSDVKLGLSGGTLTVRVAERTANLLWKSGEALYVVDLEGVVTRQIETADEIEVPLPLFYDTNDLDVSVGDSVMKSSEIENIFTFLGYLDTFGIRYGEIQVDRLAGKWMSIQTEIGFELLFDAVGDIDLQASNLEVVLSEQIDDVESIEYIDLRFGDHVYYK